MKRRRAVREGRGTPGFLLVEALTAMAIGALLLVALGSLVSLVLRASDRTATAGEQVEETSRILSTLISRIETITPQRWAGGDAGFAFQGTETSLVFARRRDRVDGTLESRLVIMSGEGRVLREEERPLPPDARDFAAVAGGEGSVVLQNRFLVRFAYFSRLADGTEALMDRWTSTGTMPVAIRVTLTDPDGALRGHVRIALHVDAEPGCAAPGQGLCSLAPRANAAETPLPDESPVDPDDSRGWRRYLKP